MKRILLALAFAPLLFTACKKENTSPLDFSGYTQTDAYCANIGALDPTDWTYDSVWTTQETKLMSFKNPLTITDSATGFVQVFPLCNNPSAGNVKLIFNTEKECKVKLAFVNYDMDILHYQNLAHVGAGFIQEFDFIAVSSFRSGKPYRLYYTFSNAADSVYYKGHGDFRIEKE